MDPGAQTDHFPTAQAQQHNNQPRKQLLVDVVDQRIEQLQAEAAHALDVALQGEFHFKYSTQPSSYTQRMNAHRSNQIFEQENRFDPTKLP